MCEEKNETGNETQVVPVEIEEKPVDVYILPVEVDIFVDYEKEEETVWN